jgi:mannan endo-1,4-beta-mannosidase
VKTRELDFSIFALALAVVATGCGGGALGNEGDGAGGASAGGTGGGSIVGGTGGAASGSGGTNGGAGATGTAGMSGGVDAGNPNMPPVMPVAGVVQGGVCVPVCLLSAVTQGDYGYENGMSCVVKGTYTASISTACIVGMPVPPPGHAAGSAGVVVSNQCVALCGAEVQDGKDANPGDGYGYEFDSSCIIPGGKVAIASLPCKTGTPVGDAGAVSGPGRLLGDSCTRICTVTTTDTDGTGYGFEFGASCLVPGTAAAMKGLACLAGVPEPTGPTITLNPNPPAGQVKKPAGMLTNGFFVTGGRLYDKFGNDFIPRGINNPDVWFDIGDQYLAYNALDNIVADGANVVRIVWETNATGGTPALLQRILRHVVELKLVPLVELHDVTGGTSNQDLLNMVAYYTSAPVKTILLQYEAFLLINIANEWSGNDFRGGYTAAVQAMRTAGINHTLIIDANGFGQNAASIMTDGAALLAADPQHNLMFSVHMYDQYANNSGGRTKITSTLQSAVTAQLPLVVGEFGWQTNNQTPIDAAFIMSECVRLKLGYLGWSWKGNSTAQAYLDLAVDWEGAQLSSWGNTLIKGTNGLSTSTVKATIYTE